jgi:hypothetical protein
MENLTVSMVSGRGVLKSFSNYGISNVILKFCKLAAFAG